MSKFRCNVCQEWNIGPSISIICSTCYAPIQLAKGQAMAKAKEQLDFEQLPDNEQWVNRRQIKSTSSNNLYIVAQNRAGRYFSCSCPAGKTRKNCKHLRAMGVPGNGQPFELGQKKKRDFMNYPTYSGKPATLES